MNMESQPTSIQSNRPFDIDQFRQLYQTFDIQTLNDLPKLYDPAIEFKDPVHQLKGIAPLKSYFANLCDPKTRCQFEFIEEILSDSQAFFKWKMYYSHPKLRAGKILTLDGGSFIKFNSHIFYHEDFYDMGAMIYQHVPILGWAVKKVNSRLQE
ncbi:MAG: nuclear transport factor 2 family protein [Cellvibrio sp.]